MTLTAARLREVLSYNSKAGIFTWRVDKFRQHGGGNAHKGARAGTINNGYQRIKIDGVIYRAARLAVLWMTGLFPSGDVDHKNLHRSDDRWINLRLASRSQNKANARAQKGKTVPLKGVSWDRQRRKYYASIRVNNRSINLGRYARAEDAHAAYVAAAIKFFGQFARAR